VRRLESLVPPDRVIVVTNGMCAQGVRAQLDWIDDRNILVEPSARNTGPAVALAAVEAAGRCGHRDPVILVVPSDHRISGDAGYVATLAAAIQAAAWGRPVLIGVKPTRGETGFGYILPGPGIGHINGLTVMAVRRFMEKPGRRRATAYLRDGRYLWNAGIFAGQAGAILDAMNRHAGSTAASEALRALESRGAWGHKADVFEQLPALSIDNWVLERERGVGVIPAAFGWDDLGSWSALARVYPADGDGNVVLGRAVTESTSGCLIDCGDRLVATLGAKNLIIVDTGDVLLVCDRSRDQEIRALRDRLRDEGLGHLL
jgi:mannose-1-phosphate guanylyltransferase